MSDPFIAEIRIFPFNFAPSGWAFCNGQSLPISQNTALFSLLGTVYGGDGYTTFALPDLQGRAPMQPGQGQGLLSRDLGETGGSESITLLQSEIPSHTHHLYASEQPATSRTPAGQLPASGMGGLVAYGPSTPTENLSVHALTPAGGGLPHNNMQPYLAVNFCIALQGIFPQRP